MELRRLTFAYNSIKISIEEIKYIIEIVNSLQESGLLIKGISETIKNEAKECKDGFVPMLLGTLGGSISENALTEEAVVRAGEGVIRAVKFSMPTHPLAEFEIQKCYQNKPKYNGVHSRNNFPEKRMRYI